VLTRAQVSGLDAATQLLLLIGSEQRNFVDLLEIGLQAAFGGNDCLPAVRLIA
jgi:hypothetical protein